MSSDRPEHKPGKPRKVGEPERSSRKGPPSARPPDRTDAKRPTPVRELMEAEREDGALADTSRQASTAPPRTFSVDGEEWVVRVGGTGRSGRGSDAGAPLLFLAFWRRTADTDRASGSPVPEKEALAVGRSLEALSDDALAELLSGARPYRPQS